MVDQAAPIGIQNCVLAESPDGMLLCGMDDRMDDDAGQLLLGFKIFKLQKILESYGYTTMVSATEWIELYNFYYNWRIDQYPHLIAFCPLNPRYILIRFGLEMAWCDVEEGSLSPVGYDGNISSGYEFHLLSTMALALAPCSALT